jgi:predicted transcriptional regulator
MAASSETINQRFAQLIQQLGLNKNAFALSLGKTASVIQHLIDGRNKPGYDLLYKVFEVYPNVSRDWVLLGRGRCFWIASLLPGPRRRRR